jgi:hypothetical protein
MFYFPQVVLTSGQSPTPTKTALKHSPFPTGRGVDGPPQGSVLSRLRGFYLLTRSFPQSQKQEFEGRYLYVFRR